MLSQFGRKSLRVTLISLVLSIFPTLSMVLPSFAAAGLNAYWINETATVTSGMEPYPFTTGTCHTSTLSQINQASGSTSPGGTCSTTYFSTYMYGYIKAPTTGNVTFYSRTDDGFRMVINGSVIISDWESQGMQAAGAYNGTGSMSMVAGEVYPIQIYHHQGTGGWGYILDWEYSGISRTTVPTSAFGTSFEDLKLTPSQSGLCQIGSSAECPALSAQEIYNLYGTTTNGAYWVQVNGAPTQVFIIFDRSIGNGSWVLALKAESSTTRFKYSDSHWESTSTLNSAFVTPETISSTGAGTDAKYPVFNSAVAEQMMAIFPDVGSSKFGGAFSNSSYGFIWRETVSVAGALNAVNEVGCPETRSTLLNLFKNARRCGFRQVSATYNANENPYSTIGNGVFSSQVDVRFFGINYIQTGSGGSPGVKKKARWGFGWNENGAGNEDSNDLVNGIGLEGTSASVSTDIPTGDHIGCCQSATGLAQTSGSVRRLGFQLFYKAPEATLGAPSSLTAVRDTSGVTTLRWTQPASGTPQEYVVQYKQKSSAWSAATTLRLISPTSSPSASLTGLAGGNNYDYRVFARTYSQPNTWNFSTTAATTSITKLATPNVPTLSSPSATSLRIVYDTVSAASSYTVRIFTAAGVQVGSDLTNSETTSTITGLSPSTSYRVTVQAIGDGTHYSNSDQSDTATTSTLAAALAPTISTQPSDITSGNNRTTSFSVSASSPDGGTLSYQWFESTTAVPSFTAITGATTATYSFTATSGYNNALFRVVITNTKNGDTEVVTSSSARLTVLNALTTPTTLAVSGNETNTATFTYTPTTNASSHTLRLYDSATSTLLSTTTSFTSGSTRTGLSPATQYYATLQAVGDGITYESSTASSPLYFTTAIRKPVISSQPTDTATTTSRSALFTVSATSPDAGTLSYQWQVSTNSGVSFSNLSNSSGISGVTTTTLTLTSLTTSEDTYRYRVVVTNTKSGVTNSETSTAATLTVNVAVSFSAPAAISTTYGVAASSSSLTAAGGTGNKTFSLSPSATGISINATTGIVSVSSSAARRSTTSFTITATDEAGATATQSISITVATGTSSITFTVPGTPRKGGTFTLSAVTSSTGTVAFRAKGRIISGCAARNVNAGTLTATCTWKPISHGPQTITASYTSNDSDWGNASSSREVIVLRRVSR